jgi:tetratricopeptide (TPR) repeat protein
MARRIRSLPETIERCQAKLAADPHSLAFAQLADAYRKQGRLEDAIRLCQDGLSRWANYASAYMVLGRAQQAKGELLAAREAFQWVLQLDPESVQALKFLGQIAEARDEAPDALASYKMALTLHPFDKEIRATLARLEGQAATAVESAPPEMAAVGTEPGGPEVEFLSTDTGVEAPSPAPAEVSAGPAIPDPEPLATETMAGLYAAQGLYDRAADIYGRLVGEFPDREDLAEKYREALTHLEKRAARQSSSDADGVLLLLETWRDVFRQLRRREKVSIAPLETRRDTFSPRQPRHTEEAPVALLQAWRDAFRRLRPGGQQGPLQVLESWRDAFRRLRTARGEGAG